MATPVSGRSAMGAAYKTALLPSLPADITAKLYKGAAIADVGCGQVRSPVR